MRKNLLKGVYKPILYTLIIFVFHTNFSKTTEEQSMELNIKANLVFFYYKDLVKAAEFYEDIIGLELVLDYGFARVYRISETSYLGLVDEKQGMHKTTEPKTVTLAFVTNEVDGWYEYLKSKGVEIRNPIASSSRHPTRGFVAYDPEGYFLEFETFLNDPENEKLLEQLKDKKSRYPKEGMKTSRPANLGFHATVFWLYYKDIPEAQRFYEENLGSRLLVKQAYSLVYSSSPTGFIGLVDESQGLHRFSEEKSVNVSFFTDDVEKWYEHLKGKKLTMKEPLEEACHEELVRAFVTLDPAGYYLEFDEFLEHEKNDILMKILKGEKEE